MADGKEELTSERKETQGRRERGAGVLKRNWGAQAKWIIIKECTTKKWKATMKEQMRRGSRAPQGRARSGHHFWQRMTRMLAWSPP